MNRSILRIVAGDPSGKIILTLFGLDVENNKDKDGWYRQNEPKGIVTIKKLYDFHTPTTYNTIYSQISQTLQEYEELLNSANEQIINKEYYIRLTSSESAITHRWNVKQLENAHWEQQHFCSILFASFCIYKNSANGHIFLYTYP